MEMLAHVRVLVNVHYYCTVVLIDVIRVGWHVTHAEQLLLQCSLVGGSSTSLLCGFLWIGMVSYMSYHLWEASIVWTSVYSVVYISVCWPPTRRIYSITQSSLQYRIIFCFSSVICSQCHYLD